MGDSANDSGEQHEAREREKNPNLFDLAITYAQAGATIAAHGGDIDIPEVQEALAILDESEGSIHHKIDAIREVMDDFARMAQSRREEAELRLKRAQSLEATVKRLEQWAIRGIEAAGLKRAGSIIPLSVCQNGGAQGIKWGKIGEPIPEPYRRVKTEYVLNVEAARADLKRLGKLPEGFIVEPRGKHLRAALGEQGKSNTKGANRGTAEQYRRR